MTSDSKPDSKPEAKPDPKADPTDPSERKFGTRWTRRKFLAVPGATLLLGATGFPVLGEAAEEATPDADGASPRPEDGSSRATAPSPDPGEALVSRALDGTIVHGDTIMWGTVFGSASTLAPGVGLIEASSLNVTVTGKKVPLLGDELKWKSSAPVPYMAPPYVMPGMATCKIMLLGADQKTINVTVEKKPAVIKGTVAMAYIMVMAPAMMPAPPSAPIPDPNPAYYGGMAKFIGTNMNVKMA